MAEALALAEAMQARLRPGAPVPFQLDLARWYALFHSGRAAESLAAAERARETAVAEAAYMEALVADVVHFTALLFGRADHPDELDAAFRLSERLTAEFQARAVVPDTWYGLGLYQWLRGHWAAARTSLVDWVDRNAGYRPSSSIYWFVSELQLASGQLDWVGALLQSVQHPVTPADEPGYSEIHPLHHVAWADYCLARGDLDLARAWLESADRWRRLRPMVPYEPLIKLSWAAWFRQAGDLPAAYRDAKAALAQGETCGNQLAVIRARRLAGEVAHQLGRTAEAEAQPAAAVLAAGAGAE
jgi:tetratricopeptide (TPR) repeat protein